MLRFKVNAGRCTRCGLCVRDCIGEIIKSDGKGLPRIARAEEGDCLRCQHCLAVCPTGAISIFGKDPRDSEPLGPGRLPALDSMLRLVRGRRSVRHYKNDNVDRALLRRLLRAVANCPTGVNQRELTFTAIDDKAVMQRFRMKTLAALAKSETVKRLPEGSYILDAPGAYAKRKEDIIFRGAPHVLIVSAPPDAPCPHEDVTLALAYFELLAQSAGLGTVWCGLLKMTLEALPELKKPLGLPEKHAYYAMLFGIPAIRFARTVQRDDAAVIRRVAR